MLNVDAASSVSYSLVMQSSDIYCEKILSGKVSVEVVKETANVLAFKHTSPYWQIHVVVIPKKHIESITRVTDPDSNVVNELIAVAIEVCTEVEKTHGGCGLSTNVGSLQSSKHLHFYIHSGERLRDESGRPIDANHQ